MFEIGVDGEEIPSLSFVTWIGIFDHPGLFSFLAALAVQG